jgi:uncharacterized protein
VGVISDTHGVLRQSALRALAGSDLILHAGDVGARSVLHGLGRIAPTRAVRGNTDGGSLGAELPETALIEVAGLAVYLVHDLLRVDLDPEAAGVAIVVSGHTHRPAQAQRGNVLYFNPGSAGPRRAGLPITVGRIVVRDRIVRAEHLELDPRTG